MFQFDVDTCEDFAVGHRDGILYLGGEPCTQIRNPEMDDNVRSIYRCGNYIVKVDMELPGEVPWELEGEIEVRLYNHVIEECDRKYFAELLSWGHIFPKNRYFYVVMKYYNIQHPLVASPIIKKLQKKYQLYDIVNDDGDNWNWGLVDGQPMIFDYGASMAGVEYT